MRTFFLLPTILFALVAQITMATVSLARAETGTVIVEVDAAQAGGAIRDLVGANKKPIFGSQTPGVNWNATSLYSAFGISQVRLHDSNVDLCTTYTAATKLNTGVTPAQPVAGCELQGSGGRPHFTWTPISSSDADLNNPNNYDFTSVDEAISAVIATGASIYLRLGESYNGPNDTGDPVAWAKIATNIYQHVLGIFKPTAGIAVNPVYVEIFNEPDGAFWAGQASTFDTLFVETAQRVRAAAAAAGKTVKVGGAGFTRNILTTSAQAGNPANGFVGAVGASTIDFFSAHLYNNCSTATLASSAIFLRALRGVVNNQGGSAKPLHITEWNIGLGSQCGNDFYADQRTQSFDSGILTLMQDPAQNIEAAHFYAAMTIMALFDFTTVAGTARINPSAWAFWAHSKLRGANFLSAQVCPQGSACVAGYAAESAPLLALAGQVSGGQDIVVTNDGSTAVTYTLRVKGLTSATVAATISTPPSGKQDLPANGNPIVADAAALATLIASVAKDTRSALTVSGGAIDIAITLPAHGLQLVEVRPASTVVEFYNANLDNYFITADAGEATAIDNGGAGPGWSRTGNSFKSGGSTSVCRFYGSQSPGPNSHFYTVDSGECNSLKQLQASTPDTEKRWNFESLDFVSTPTTSSNCPAGTTPVYRAYNNGFTRGVDSNHRIASSTTAIQEVVNRGWKNEGVVMCAPQ